MPAGCRAASDLVKRCAGAACLGLPILIHLVSPLAVEETLGLTLVR
jgi:hypothetical protein